MRAAGVALLLCAACAPVTIIPRPAPAAPPGPRASPPPGVQEVEARIHALVNEHRATLRLPPLRFDPGVAAVARRHSEAMAAGRVPFGHDGFSDRAEEVKRMLGSRSMAENVAYDSRNPPDVRVMANWLNSPGHRRNIEGTFQLTGVGVARASDGTFYLTQLFVRMQ